MPVLPDAISVGRAVIPTPPLLIVAGIWIAYMVSGKRAERYGLQADCTEATLLWVVLAAWLGAKVPDLIRSPLGIIENPRLLVILPVGVVPAISGLVGAILAVLLRHRGKLRFIPVWLDAMSVPFLSAVAVACLAMPDARAIPTAIGFAFVALVVGALEKQARFPGHVFLAAVVFGACAVALGDLFRPPRDGWPLISPAQLISLLVALAGYTVAWWGDGGSHEP